MSIRIGSRIFAPRLFTTLLTLVLIALLVSLGRWQLRRADEKRALFDSFAAGTDAAEYVRQRHLVVRWPIPAAALGEAALVGTLAGFAEAAKPLLAFGWEAI